MRVTILLVVLSYSSASASFDWDKIQPKNAFMSPKNNVSNLIGPRIVGGSEVKPHSRPYQVAIVIDSEVFCGGTLISRRYVLTAAHCLEGYAYFQVILGAHNIRKTESSQQVVTSTIAIIHPDYNPENLNNDIGLIRLPNELIFNEFIEPIPLATENSSDYASVYPFVSGWGRISDNDTALSSTLQELWVYAYSNQYCTEYYDASVILNSTICTSGKDLNGPCGGDSGGPLVYDNKLIGIVSFSSPLGCEAGQPTGYARISSFWRWIIENTDLNNE